MAGAEFMVRGPVRAVRTATQFNDFLSPYIQANAWIRGLDPYSPQTLLKLWPAQAPHFSFLPKEVANGTLVANRGIPTAYPITALVLVAPFSLLPWNVAYAIWLAINLVLFPVTVCVLLSLAGVSYREPAGILLTAAALALAPFHTGIVTGNVSMVAIELSVIAIWAARRRRDVATAVLLAIAAGLKPQIGLCFLLYYLVRRRWRIVGVGLALLAGLAAVGLFRLDFGHTPWLGNYLNDNHILLETGVLGNFTSINPTRFGLINLQVALYPLLGSIGLTNGVAVSVGVIFLIAWLIGMARRCGDDEFELLDLSAIAVISLLPIYHRFYDAALLIFPLGWVILSFGRSRRFAVFSLLLMLPFLIPGGTLLETMESSGRIPSALAHRWWWEMIVMPHQVWLLLLLGVLLLCEMVMERSSPTVRGL
jgi:glycosyl transferase family 87